MADTSWHSDAFPELRSGPPWVMQEMIAAQPALAEADARQPVAGGLGDRRRDRFRAGCRATGHGDRVRHLRARRAWRSPSLIAGAAAPGRRALVRARPALSAALDAADGVCLAVSHDGADTRHRARPAPRPAQAGASTAAITHDASTASPPRPIRS